MSSRRDAVQAYSFTVRRLRSGMLHGEPDTLDPGSARTWRGVIVGIVVALVVGAGIAVFGFISPAKTDDWRASGTLVVASDTGARYLYLDSLHPVLNQTSARLIAGTKMTVKTVSSSSLAGTPQGAPIGIVGAPDSVPGTGSLNHGAWLACAARTTAEDGTSTTRLVLRVDESAAGTGFTSHQAAWVRSPDGAQYLVWAGRRLRIDQDGGAAAALGYGTSTPIDVPTGFLDALPAGADLAATLPDSLGAAGPSVGGQATKVGRLFRDANGQGYVLTTGGLHPVTATELALLRGHPMLQKLAYGGATPTVTEIGPQDVPHGTSAGESGSGLPASPPVLVAPSSTGSLCSATRADGSTLTTTIETVPSATVLAGAQGPSAQPGVQPSCEGADLVAVHPGSGTLVSVRTGAGASATHYLVADNGVKYPLPADAMTQFGYAGASTEVLPSSLLRLLPSGPSLDPSVLAQRGVVSAPATSDCAG